MAIQQSIWTLDGKKLDTAVLNTEKELEDLLYGNIAILNPDWLIIGRQVAVKGGYIDLNQNTVCRPANDKRIFTIDRLKKLWDID